jgi:hypothetical protein
MDGAMEAPSPIEDDAEGSAPPTIGPATATIVDDPPPSAAERTAASTRSHDVDERAADEYADADAQWDAPIWIDRLWDRVGALGWRRIITFLTVAAATLLILTVLHPGLILRDTTPTGGDMGAHVWGPAYLRDHLLPKGQLAGWSPDWYNGFPAFQFYMVLPSLLIVMLNVGLDPLPAALTIGALAGLVFGVYRDDRMVRYRRATVVVACIVAVLSIGMPYGVAFKIVASLGWRCCRSCSIGRSTSSVATSRRRWRVSSRSRCRCRCRSSTSASCTARSRPVGRADGPP